MKKGDCIGDLTLIEVAHIGPQGGSRMWRVQCASCGHLSTRSEYHLDRAKRLHQHATCASCHLEWYRGKGLEIAERRTAAFIEHYALYGSLYSSDALTTQQEDIEAELLADGFPPLEDALNLKILRELQAYPYEAAGKSDNFRAAYLVPLPETLTWLCHSCGVRFDKGYGCVARHCHAPICWDCFRLKLHRCEHAKHSEYLTALHAGLNAVIASGTERDPAFERRELPDEVRQQLAATIADHRRTLDDAGSADARFEEYLQQREKAARTARKRAQANARRKERLKNRANPVKGAQLVDLWES